MTLIVLPLPGNDSLAQSLSDHLACDLGEVQARRFPDGESYLRILSSVAGRLVILVSTLDRPDEKLLPLAFAARTARELGATGVGLVCPYLAYMRQDRRFQTGEAITSVHFAALVSSLADWMVTVDPHLHRRSTLSEIYSIPTRTLHAAPPISAWIAGNVENPILIGPDSESEQWISEIAGAIRTPYLILAKTRRGDREVEVSLPDPTALAGRTPVLADDIVSTARTMIETVRRLAPLGVRKPVCIGVHAIFADRAYEELTAAGAGRIVTCNTIAHRSNAIDLTSVISDGVRDIIIEVA